MGVPANLVLGPFCEVHGVEHLVDSGCGRPVESVERRTQLEIPAAAQVRVEAWRLDEAGDPLERRHAELRVTAEDSHGSGAWPNEPEHHPQRRSLAGAVRAQIAEHIP